MNATTTTPFATATSTSLVGVEPEPVLIGGRAIHTPSRHSFAHAPAETPLERLASVHATTGALPRAAIRGRRADDSGAAFRRPPTATSGAPPQTPTSRT